MTTLNAFVLGLVQGLAEFLPVSSSGHLVIFQNILELPDSKQYLVFDILLHVGTLISVLFFYWRDIVGLIKAFFEMVSDIAKGMVDIKKQYHRFLVLIVIATLPLCVVLVFKDKIESAFSSPLFVGSMLLITGVLLLLTDRVKHGSFTEENIPFRSAFIIGLFQLFAIFPGISRSGSTIFGSIIAKGQRRFAVKFSLLLSVVAVLGAAVTSVPDIISGEGLSVPPLQCIIGMVTAGVSGILAIKFLVKMLNRGKFKYFALYCWAVGVITIILSI
ncbi:MAG: Undecaprenyl-diphosphatase [Firmicutes bacterium ADurb.Bin193]|nr:MAG: Undecaprenyl-diphosphatase [Firmicutes bacterium ADurb.Bin193]